MDDEAAVATIAAVCGLGRWTAEVYLLFSLGRDDVFSLRSSPLPASAAQLKGLAEWLGPMALRVMADAWRPARTLAARLLWRHWRHVTGRPALDDFPAS